MNLLRCLLLTCLWRVVTSFSPYCFISTMKVKANGHECDVNNDAIGFLMTHPVTECRVSLMCIGGAIIACVSETSLCTILAIDCKILMREITPRVDRLICKK